MLLFESLSRIVFNDQYFCWSRGTVLLTHSSGSSYSSSIKCVLLSFLTCKQACFQLELGTYISSTGSWYLRTSGWHCGWDLGKDTWERWSVHELWKAGLGCVWVTARHVNCQFWWLSFDLSVVYFPSGWFEDLVNSLGFLLCP